MPTFLANSGLCAAAAIVRNCAWLVLFSLNEPMAFKSDTLQLKYLPPMALATWILAVVRSLFKSSILACCPVGVYTTRSPGLNSCLATVVVICAGPVSPT